MHQPLKSLSLVTATLLLSLASPLQVAGTTSGTSIAQAQAQTNQNRKDEANRLSEQGMKQLNAGQVQAALQSWQQALTIYQEIQNRQGQGQTLKNIGNAYYTLKDYTKAIEYQQKALAIAREIRDRELEGRALNNLGLAHKELGDSAKAIEYYQEALAIAREIHNRKLEQIALNNLGFTYVGLGDSAKTVEYYQQVLAIARELKERSTEAAALAYMGNAYASLNNNQKAIEFAQQALSVARQNKNSGVEAIALDTLTRAYSSLEEPQKVLEFGQASLAVARQIKNKSFEWRALVFLCEAHYFLGNSQQAVEFAQQSLVIAQESKNRTFESGTLSVLSRVHAVLRDYQKAIEFAQQSLVIAQEIKNRKLESAALSDLGFAYWALRDYQKALEYGQQALVIHREFKDLSSELSTLHNLNTNYIYLGDYEKVIELSQQELALARKIKNYDYEGIALTYLGFAYFAQGDSQKIIEYGQQALAVGRGNKSPLAEYFALLALSIGYGNLGNTEKALEFSQATLAIAKNPKVGKRFVESEQLALNIMGGLYRQIGQKDKAIATYRESLAMDNNGFTAEVGLARAYRELNMPITAITYYKQAIKNVEKVRGKLIGLDRQLQDSFLQAFLIDRDKTKNADIYRELADLLLSQRRIIEAQQVLELLKVEELRDFTGNRRAGGDKKETAFTPTEEKILKENGTLIAFGQRLYECQQTRCNQLSQLLDQRDVLTQQFNQKIQGIEQEVRDRLPNDPGILDAKDIRREARKIVEAQDGTVLIYVFVVQDKTWLLWASKGGVVNSKEVPVGQKQLGETVLKFRQLLETPSSDIAEVQATGKQLYDWLIKPLEAELKGNQVQKLVFSLDRVTRYIPMSALFDGEKYLIENYAVSTVLSAGLTDTSARLPPGTENTPVLALGLSDAVADFNPLPNVPIEIDAIVRKQQDDTKGIYPGLAFLNQAFDFRALRDNLIDRKILHIATHGKFVPGRPNDSFLLLGTGDKLTIPQIETLQDLGDVHLVVLSACETALGGADQDGLEISGISYYLLNTGAKAVAASLWLVNDASTSQLMQKFYSNLAQGTDQERITKAQALRQAQLGMLRGDAATGQNPDSRTIFSVEFKPGLRTNSTNSTAPGFSHPYYWAPFILIGNSF